MTAKKSSAERLFSRYKTYEGERGDPSKWREVLSQSLGDNTVAEALSALGLSGVPGDQEALKRARRQAMQTAHPDKGGDAGRAASINAAYERLSGVIAPPRPLASTDACLIDPPRCTASLPAEFSDDHVAELKLDGLRYLLYLGFHPYGGTNSYALLSRHKSKADGRFVDKTDNIPHIAQSVAAHAAVRGKTVLDGEMFICDWKTSQSIMGSSPLEAADKQINEKITYFVFDMPFWNGEDLRSKPYVYRRRMLETFLAELGNPYIKPMPQFTGDIHAAFKQVVAEGGEGLIVKDRHAPYGQGWAKYKKSADVSGFIIGFKEGKGQFSGFIGAVEIGVYGPSGAVESIGWASGFTNALREAISADKQSYLGRVVDVFAQEISTQNKLRHPTFHRFRDEMPKTECTLAKIKRDIHAGLITGKQVQGVKFLPEESKQSLVGNYPEAKETSMTAQLLKDRQSNTIGRIETHSNGIQYGYNKQSNCVGTYNPKTNETRDKSSNKVGSGNLLASLIMR